MIKINKLEEKFLLKSYDVFGDRFDYASIKYVNSKTKIRLRCKKHDHWFEQVPSEHLRGKVGCGHCTGKELLTTENFINQSNDIHGDIYDYSESNYINSTTKINIICPEHGKFSQLPNHHLKGQGCYECGVIKRSGSKVLTSEEFINKSKLIHGNKYDYSKSNYVDSTTKINIICSEHGEFMQQPSNHIRGKGCTECARELTRNKLRLGVDEMYNRFVMIHGNKYSYDLPKTVTTHDKIVIICPEHGEFEQVVYDHLSGHSCGKCSSSVSSYEFEISDYLKTLGLEHKTSTNSEIKPYQLDIYIPSHKLAIEFDGLYWHSEGFLGKGYHLMKTTLCEEQGIRLIHIFEDEWLYKCDIVKSRLKSILGLETNKIYGRHCKVMVVDGKLSAEFLDNNHLQGSTNGSIRLGLYHDNELVSLMIFNKPRLGIGGGGDHYELSRFCVKQNLSVVGGFSKLLKHFMVNYEPKEIVSYADKRWSDGKVYEVNGFTKKLVSKPNYWYIVGKTRKHRFNFRKSVLRKEGFDTKNKTERQIMLERGINRIYDCGTITYTLLTKIYG
jgi:very-short-patch-repair endonuclease